MPRGSTGPPGGAGTQRAGRVGDRAVEKVELDSYGRNAHNRGMRRMLTAFALAALAVPLAAQEPKPVPKNSIRVSIPGCSRGQLFQAGRPSEDQPGGSAVPEGSALRMNGPKKLMAEIKGHEGSRIEITGLMRRGQPKPGGFGVGGVRIGGGPPTAPLGGGGVTAGVGSAAPPALIDVEGYRVVPGDCPTR